MLEGAALALAHYGHGGGEGGADLQDDADDPGHEKIRAAHGRVVKDLRPDFDREIDPPALVHQAPDGLGQGQGDRGVEALQGGGGVRAVDQHLHPRGKTGPKIAGEMGRDLQADVGFAFADFARELFFF